MSEDDVDSLAARAVALAATLPAPVAAGGLKAISRLIGGLADIPAAWLRRASQEVEDGTNARTLVSNALAVAAAERAVSDPAVVERAMSSLLGKAARQQINREAVAEQAVEALQEEPSISTGTEPPEEVEDDWLNVFERYAEDASSERARILWGRVLAGEIRKPRSFSLATLRFLSEADQHIVQVAQRVAALMVGRVILKDDQHSNGQLFADLLEAEAAGLVSGVGMGIGGTEWSIKLSEDGRGTLVGRTHALAIEGPADHKVSFPVIVVTRVGSEVAKLSAPGDEPALFRTIAEVIKNDPDVTAIHIGPITGPNTMAYPCPYWTRDS